jgi:hypothetical protein
MPVNDPRITDDPPPEVAADIAALTAALNAQIPPQADDNILVATWNIRAFGDLTRKWASMEGDSPRRDLHAALAIAQILQRFDVIAVQEVKANLRALRDILKWLGDDWSFALTDVTHGDKGNDERLAYLFNIKRAQLSGLACELVVPEDLKSPYAAPANAFQRQFVRTPYAVSFRAGQQTFEAGPAAIALRRAGSGEIYTRPRQTVKNHLKNGRRLGPPVRGRNGSCYGAVGRVAADGLLEA